MNPVFDADARARLAALADALIPAGEDQWLASVSRHWNLDRADPR